ncbi:MAG: tRNA uracil 4-sulfurtransferase [Thermotogota bacterium]|nr:tRNA uracil 4-sulfurtransferase [Thermotogota bacterium]MDK2864593.1 tRNA uracil 4-sulfurtransferase [Thermotogota bacterium]
MLFMIRFAEIALKGKNKKMFLDRLRENLISTLGRHVKVRVEHDRLYVDAPDHEAFEAKRRISSVFGVQNFSPVVKVERDVQKIEEAIKELLNQHTPVSTFKVNTRRSDKTFPVKSQELNARLGSFVLEHFPEMKVDLHNPELEIGVEIRREGVYVYGERIKGPGGLPVGSTGRALLLLSGGIDSPVAGWMAMKRGVRIEAIHFASPPYTGEKSREKVLDICGVLARYSAGIMKLYIVPFTKLQVAIHRSVPIRYSIVVQRRAMMRISSLLAEKTGALALVTGENLGQVGSQTMENLNTIAKATGLLVLRPLVGMDKIEIMELAKRIGTYDISIRPYEDCCTVFVPPNPATKSRPEHMEELEKHIEGYWKLIEESVERVETIDVKATW